MCHLVAIVFPPSPWCGLDEGGGSILLHDGKGTPARGRTSLSVYSTRAAAMLPGRTRDRRISSEEVHRARTAAPAFSGSIESPTAPRVVDRPRGRGPWGEHPPRLCARPQRLCRVRCRQPRGRV